jgi:hypothetical protein
MMGDRAISQFTGLTLGISIAGDKYTTKEALAQRRARLTIKSIAQVDAQKP